MVQQAGTELRGLAKAAMQKEACGTESEIGTGQLGDLTGAVTIPAGPTVVIVIMCNWVAIPG